MSETIWRATDNDGRCWYYGEKPDWSEHQFYSQDGRVLEYYGTEKPPPGECWEMTVTRKGDIDTDGDPIGWKIVGIGKDGSVLCEKGNGQRRRYSFERKGDQPSGEAWERLVAWAKESIEIHRSAYSIASRQGLETNWEAFRDRTKERIAEGVEVLKAYESAQSTEPSDRQATIEVLTKERDEAVAEVKRLKQFENLYSHAINCVDRVFQIDSKKPRPLLPNFARLGECKFRAVIRLAEEYDERNATIAELRSELDETRTERHAYKSRLREFCQRLVDMVGAEGPEDVQGMLDKVNAELHRLKQNIDSLNASLADKEGFLNSAGDEIERLTKERDEARAELAKPEMPECVAKLLQTFQPVGQSLINAVQTVRDHYAPPFRIEGPGVYETEDGNPWEVIYIDPKGGVVARHETTKLLENFHVSGSCKGGNFSLTKYLRPLE